MAVTNEYFDLTDKHKEEYGEKTVVLMQVGAFFEVYGMIDKVTKEIIGTSIIDICSICELNVGNNLAVIRGNKTVKAGFRDYSLEKYIKLIQDAGFTCAVYTQDENKKDTSRSLLGIFSPGTYFQSEPKSLTNNVSCVWIDYYESKILNKGKYIVVGVANIDVYNGKSYIFQFQETYINSPTTYDELERFMSIYNPSEIILISNLPAEKDMDNVISYTGISSALIHKVYTGTGSKDKPDKLTRVKNFEKQPYQKEILSKFFKYDNYEVFSLCFYDNNVATQAFCYLLDFIYQHNHSLINKIALPIFENSRVRLTLANHSLKQLNMINDGNVKPGRLSCVADFLNFCVTPMGKRKFLDQILNPSFDEVALSREYDIIEYINNSFDYNYFNKLRTHLSYIKDLSNIERQICLKKFTPKSMCKLYASVAAIGDIFDIVKTNNTIMNYLKLYDTDVTDIGRLCNKVNTFIANNIDVGLAADIEGTIDVNIIKPGVNHDIDKNVDKLAISEMALGAIHKYLCSLIATKDKTSKSKDFIEIYSTDKGSVGLAVTNRRCNLLLDALPAKDTTIKLNTNNNKEIEFIVSKTRFSFNKQSKDRKFISDPQIDEYCENIMNIKVSIKTLINDVYNIIVENLSNFSPELERIITFITQIDAVFNKAYIAKQFNYCKPIIVDNTTKSFVEAKGLRHCLIEQFQRDEIYVTNDISLGDGITDGILLYGTNAVGKTTLIRALGISIIMAQAGLFVPCSSFRYKPYKRIFTRIIGNDNIFKGLSTFEVEMSELRTILALMDENSLILGDELCSGTETCSAISIFMSGIHKLHKSHSSFIFATHLHEIVDYEEVAAMTRLSLKHMEVIYDKETDALIYDRKLREGSGSKLYGLEVCKSLNLPQDFLDYANEIRLKYNPDDRSVLSLKQSRYNVNKLIGLCEKCGKNPGKEVHHLQHQADADANGTIRIEDGIFNKNNLANLMVLCDACHDEIHKNKLKQKRVKTTKGTKLIITP